MSLVDQCLSRGHQPEIVLIDGGYGNNTSFLNQLEKRNLTYIGGLAKNRKVIIKKQDNIKEEIRLEQLAETISTQAFNLVQLSTKKKEEVWVATLEVQLSRMSGQKTIAIVMNAKNFSDATDINYYITNIEHKYVTSEWIYSTYSKRNWVEVFVIRSQRMVRAKRISSQRSNQLEKAFYFSPIVLIHLLSGIS